MTGSITPSTAVESIRRAIESRRWSSAITEDGRELLIDHAATEPDQVVVAELFGNAEPLRAAVAEEGAALLSEIDRLHALIAAPHPVVADAAALFARNTQSMRPRPDGTGGVEAVAWADHQITATVRAAGEGTLTWADLVDAEAAVALSKTDPGELRGELLQLAATVLAWAADLDKRGGGR